MKLFSRILMVAFLLVGANSAFAQFSIGLSGNVAIPVSGEFENSDGLKLNDVAETGFGGTLHFRYHLNESSRLGLNVGLFGHDVKDDVLPAGVESSLRFIPITLSFDYAFAEEGFMPYIGAEAGLFLNSQKVEGFGEEFTSDTFTDFGVAPVVGFRYGFSDVLELDFAVKYYFIFLSEQDSDDFSRSSITAGILPISIGLNYKFGN